MTEASTSRGWGEEARAGLRSRAALKHAGGWPVQGAGTRMRAW